MKKENKRIRGRKPTRAERKILESNGFDTYTWLILKNTSTTIELMNSKTGEIETIEKEPE